MKTSNNQSSSASNSAPFAMISSHSQALVSFFSPFALIVNVLIKSVSKFESTRSFFDEIPSHIISDIFSRLPIKTCLNCKLVCKEWYEIITSLEFAEYRSIRSSYLPILLFGNFENGEKNFLLLDFHNSSSKIDEMGNFNESVVSIIKFKSKFNTSLENLYVVNQCNGLICLKSLDQWSPYIICNLLTTQQLIIEQKRQKSCSVDVYGLGQCTATHQYKVVRILNFAGSLNNYVAEIQTIGNNEWRRIGESPQFQLRRSGAFLHGSLHKYSYRDNCIWAFHFGNEQFSRISIPDCIRRELYIEVGVFDSKLCFNLMSKNFQCENWVMEEFGVKDSWVKKYVFQVESFVHRMPLFEIDERKILVSNNNGVDLGVCDIESGRYKRVRVPGISSLQVMACDTRFSNFEDGNPL